MFEKITQMFDNTLIPKKLHAIWLGGILREDGRKNITDWKEKNPDYEANVWIDSSTYLNDDSPEAINQKKEYIQFKEWAKTNQINIIDINPKSTETDPFIIKRPELFEEMNSSKYYSDELIDPGSNYAAASDILRVEILYREGGVYFDAEDVFPDKPLGQLTAKEGILIHSYHGDYLNNDLIASLPQGEKIEKFRDLIQKNYDQLYSKEKRYLMAHRFAHLSSFRTDQEDRKLSTINISGPGALRKIIGHSPRMELKFSQIYWDTPAQQALSWLDKDFTSIEKVAPYLRLNLIEYYNLLIDDFSTSADTETNKLLTRFQDAINSKPASVSMIELINHVKPLFTQQEIEKIDSSTNNLFSTFESHSTQVEEFLLYCKHGNVDPDHLHRFIKGRGAYYYRPEPIESAMKHPFNIIHFFHEQLSKGFFEIIKLPEIPLIDHRSPWKYSFSDEQQKQLTEQVKTDMLLLRQQADSREQNKTEITDDKQVNTVPPAALEMPPLQSNQQELQPDIHLEITYPYGKSGSGRSHLTPVEYDGEFKNYKGDVLKRKILERYKSEIEQCSTFKQLNVMLKSMLVSKEFEVLKTPQRLTSVLFELKTSSIESLEQMLNDAISQIELKNKTNKIQDEELISLEGELELFDEESKNITNRF